MDDLISRKAAIDALMEILDRPNHAEFLYTDEVCKTLNELPSSQPERKRGKWIDYTDDGNVECPFCGSATNCDGNISELHYCFSCGCDMREVNKNDG